MKNNYNPYMVPENFFETTGKRAIAKFRRRRCAIRIGIAAMAVAAFLFVIPTFNKHHIIKQQETQDIINNLADMYEYDIFLQVNFTE